MSVTRDRNERTIFRVTNTEGIQLNEAADPTARMIEGDRPLRERQIATSVSGNAWLHACIAPWF